MSIGKLQIEIENWNWKMKLKNEKVNWQIEIEHNENLIDKLEIEKMKMSIDNIMKIESVKNQNFDWQIEKMKMSIDKLQMRIEHSKFNLMQMTMAIWKWIWT